MLSLFAGSTVKFSNGLDVSLSLSHLGLKDEDLPVQLLSRLTSLEKLDLSGNRLQGMPVGLTLPSLRILDCSNNDIEDITSIQPFTALEELNLEDNLYLTVRIQFQPSSNVEDIIYIAVNCA